MSHFAPAQSRPESGAGSGLRPRTVADLLDEAFALLKRRRDYLLVAGIILIPQAIVSAWSAISLGNGGVSTVLDDYLNAIETGGDFDTRELRNFSAIGQISGLCWLLFTPLASGIICRIAGSDVLDRPVSGGTATRGMLRLWPALIVSRLLALIAIIAASLILLVPVLILVGVVAVANPFLALPLVLLMLVPGMALYLLFLLTDPVIAMEFGKGRSFFVVAVSALQRSWQLMTRRFWTYAVVAISMGAITTLISFLISAVGSGISGLLYSNDLTPFGWLIDGIFALVNSVLTAVLPAIAAVLIYFDARVRFEGLDLALRAEQSQPVVPAQVQAQAPGAEVLRDSSGRSGTFPDSDPFR